VGIVFVGFMGAGKSTLARLVGDRLGLPVLDLDATIADRAGMSIADVFDQQGESAFRSLEREAIAAIPPDFEGLVAAGGGAWHDPGNRDRLLSVGPVVALDADPEVLWTRVQGSERPLARDRSAFGALFEHRREALATVPWHLDTCALPLPELVDHVVTRFFGPAHDLEARFEGGATAIRLAPGGLIGAGAWLARLREPGPCTLVSEREGAGRYVGTLAASLVRAGFQVRTLWLPSGEAAKSWSVVADLHEELARAGHERHQPLIALGGGALGDAAGFVAATYLRGVPLVQVPTTLLSQVDSSVGGKVAIDLASGKNLVGAFWPADQVLVDPLVLQSLEPRDRSGGLAEVVKMALIEPDGWFDELETGLPALLAGELSALVPALRESILRKARLVEADPRERSVRAWLNLGHTVGHAIETLTGHGIWRHGEAVAVGLVAAHHLSLARGLVSASRVERVEDLLRRLDLPVRLPGELRPADLLEVMRRDKKVREGRVRFVLPRETEPPCVEPLETETLLDGLAAIQER